MQSDDAVWIFRTPIRIDPSGASIAAHADVWMQLNPVTPLLMFELRIAGLPAAIEQHARTGSLEVQFPNDDRPREVYQPLAVTDPLRLYLPGPGPLVLGEFCKAESIEFDLMNFTELRAPGTQGDLRLVADSLVVELKRIAPSPCGLAYYLNPSKPKYTKSHTGLITQSAVPLDLETVGDISRGLELFLTFCRGAFTAPSLLRCRDREETTAWLLVGTPHVTEERRWQSWLDPNHGSMMEQLFSGFWRLWSIDHWKEPLGRAIYWYARANEGDSGPDTSLVLSQSALEILSWVLLVLHEEALTKSGYSKLAAVDKIRLLLSYAGIPRDIPAPLATAARPSKELGLDGPGMVTSTRNAILHPIHGDADQLRPTHIDCARLALWYLELVILSTCGFQGVYSNRLTRDWRGNVEPVPWSG